MTAKAATKPETVMVLRTCRPDGGSSHGFVWPLKKGRKVAAPDWNPEPECGAGLHGLLWGAGAGDLLDWSEDAVWMVVEVPAEKVVDLGGKVKFPHCHVRYVGDRQGATAFLDEHAQAREVPVVAATRTAGDSGTATAGYRGTATAGDYGTATAGYRGTATAGYRGTATAGDRGTATAGDSGTATAGYRGTATAGDSGTATAGYRGTATAGEDGALIIRRYDARRGVYTLEVAKVDGEKIKPGVAYKLDDSGEFVEASGD